MGRTPLQSVLLIVTAAFIERVGSRGRSVMAEAASIAEQLK